MKNSIAYVKIHPDDFNFCIQLLEAKQKYLNNKKESILNETYYFTNRKIEEMLDWFNSFTMPIYISTDDYKFILKKDKYYDET